MCCVCNLLCKIISFIISLLFAVAVILLILWGVGVIFGSNDSEGEISTVSPEPARKLLSALQQNVEQKLYPEH